MIINPLHNVAISIVTPSYNQGAFLAETIESVLSQGGDFSIDYIIIDGGSSDNSVEIITKYETLLQRGEWHLNCHGITFRWVSEQDRGQTDALLKGFCMATGSIFAWLNSDDTYLPDALQTVTNFFRHNRDAGLMYGEANYCDAAGTCIGRYRTEDFKLDKLASANIICQPAAFFRRASFETVGGLDDTLHFAMDYDLWIKLGRHFSCHHIHQLLAHYRLHKTSKTINSDTLTKNSEESLEVTRRHFGWAPVTRVYTSCHILCSAHLPGLFRLNRLAVTAAALLCTLFRSLKMNHGFHRKDLQLLSRKNFYKLFKSRLEIMTGNKP